MDDRKIVQALRRVWEVKQDKIKGTQDLIREMDFLGYRDVAQWARTNTPQFENWIAQLGVAWQTHIQDEEES